MSSPFRPDCLSGKVVLVTGGGSGIGYQVTMELLAHGCAGALIVGRRKAFLQKAASMLQQAVKGATVYYAVGDVRKPSDCQAAVELCRSKFGRLDVLVNGAAGNFLASARNLSPKGFATVMAIDALGTYNMSHAAFELLSQHQQGLVLNISATLQYGATWWQAHASAAKAAVDSLTRSLALEWGSHGIRVVGIAPGPIANTPGTTKLAPGSSAEQMAKQGIPLGRMGQAFEIGHAAVYLCTAEYVTGDVLVVDGGQWLYKPPLVPADQVEALSRQVETKSRSQAPRANL